MPVFGELIFETRDTEGPVRVLDDGNRRILAFGEATEQSSLWKDDPARLLFPYTQALMLGLLFVPEHPRTTLLGIGAGSMLQALLAYRPGVAIDAVEKRALVVEVARDWFDLPEDERLSVHVDDALNYLARVERPSHLLFADLFHEGGMDTQQTDAVFLRLCHDALGPEGVLAMNLWDTHYEESRDHLRALEQTFDGAILTMAVPGGNQLVFGFRGGLPRLNPKLFLKDAQRLGMTMHIPLRDYANRLLQTNRARLSRARPVA